MRSTPLLIIATLLAQPAKLSTVETPMSRIERDEALLDKLQGVLKDVIDRAGSECHAVLYAMGTAKPEAMPVTAKVSENSLHTVTQIDAIPMDQTGSFLIAFRNQVAADCTSVLFKQSRSLEVNGTNFTCKGMLMPDLERNDALMPFLRCRAGSKI